ARHRRKLPPLETTPHCNFLRPFWDPVPSRAGDAFAGMHDSDLDGRADLPRCVGAEDGSRGDCAAVLPNGTPTSNSGHHGHSADKGKRAADSASTDKLRTEATPHPETRDGRKLGRPAGLVRLTEARPTSRSSEARCC